MCLTSLLSHSLHQTTDAQLINHVPPITPVTLTASNSTDAELINHVPITHVTLIASNSTEAQLITQHLLAMPGQHLCETCYFIKDFTVVFSIVNIYEKPATSMRNRLILMLYHVSFSIVNIYEKWAMSMRKRLFFTFFLYTLSFSPLSTSLRNRQHP